MLRENNFNVLEVKKHAFNNGAFTLAFILSESHLTLHTWPEKEYKLVCIDLFSCKKGFSLENLVGYFTRFFKGNIHKKMIIIR